MELYSMTVVVLPRLQRRRGSLASGRACEAQAFGTRHDGEAESLEQESDCVRENQAEMEVRRSESPASRTVMTLRGGTASQQCAPRASC